MTSRTEEAPAQEPLAPPGESYFLREILFLVCGCLIIGKSGGMQGHTSVGHLQDYYLGQTQRCEINDAVVK